MGNHFSQNNFCSKLLKFVREIWCEEHEVIKVRYN